MAPKTKTIKHMLLDALEDLDRRQQKRFCARLLDRAEEPRVRRSAVEDADETRIVDAMVSTFTEAGALKLTLEILREIECNDVAKRLEPFLADIAPESAAGTPGVKEEMHFVDKHRISLIKRTGLVGPLLDRLLEEKVINQESYNIVLSKATTQDKMRFLFSGPLNSSGTRGKDVLYKALEENEPYLVEDLKAY